MNNDHEKLKALLLSEEMAQIKALQQVLNDNQALSQKISQVLDTATDMTIAENPAFQKKFSKIDAEAYVHAIKVNKQSFIDALLPIVGPMIRQSVGSAIRRFVTDINHRVEMGFSAKALRWRWTAFKTGVPFAEIMFNNTVQYQVQQIFLIDNHSGLLIKHVGNESALLQDKDAMSAMLTAIQDFVKDSVSTEGDGLTAAELGDEIVWLIRGSLANMAIVIKGAPSQKLHETIATSSENIHLNFHREISNQNLWNNSPELSLELEKLLLTKSQGDVSNEPKKSFNIWPWLLIFLALITWWSWSSYQHHKLTEEITTQLNQTPGFSLVELNYDSGDFIATGFIDPLTETSHLNEKIILNGTPFISLDDHIIAKRINNMLDNKQLAVSSINNHITITGQTEKDASWQQKIQLIGLLPGVNKITDSTKALKPEETLASYLAANPPPDTLQIIESGEKIMVSGTASATVLASISTAVAQFGAIDTSSVVVIDVEKLTDFINSNPLIMSNPKQLSASETKQLSAIKAAFLKITQVNPSTQLKLTAKSDCQGSLKNSNQNNQFRLNSVTNYLSNENLTINHIITKTKPCSVSSNTIDLKQIGVWFEVTKP